MPNDWLNERFKKAELKVLAKAATSLSNADRSASTE